jgi:hypothetical protein
LTQTTPLKWRNIVISYSPVLFLFFFDDMTLTIYTKSAEKNETRTRKY